MAKLTRGGEMEEVPDAQVDAYLADGWEHAADDEPAPPA